MKILWLASTYPSALHPFDGDFVQRHAQAAALFTGIEMIHVIKDADGRFTDDVKETVTINDLLTERIIYYKPFKTSIAFIDRLFSGLKYKRLYRDAVKKYIEQNGKPAFIHVHIAMKAGLAALWLKRKFKIPYIITEHWGGYLTEARPNISDYNYVYKYYWKKIFTGALACTFVSKYLQDHLIKTYNIQNAMVIPNVVNTGIFYPAQKQPSGKTRFIHISTMIYQKNTEAIILAMSLVKEDHPVELYLYGPVNPSLEVLIIDLGLQQIVFTKGEVQQEVLSKAIQQSDALILYSRFETFGCVLIEANACGVPVIVSDLEVFHEIIEEGVNGLFVEGENPAALAEKLRQFIAQKEHFNKKKIAAIAAEKYNYKKVGHQFIELYAETATATA
jgi:glycosyltransferase involved in cell wall biosynthesis